MSADDRTAAPGGTLFVVATPIGNLGDVTRRAVETLASADVVVAEDTRRTRALLTHLGIPGKEIVALDANASDRKIAALADRLGEGAQVAVVTDAGTPGVSDPGTALVRAAVARGARVVPIPGASAVTSAVAVSGFVDGPFSFFGFLPRKGEKRRRVIQRIAASVDPVVLFEAPGRMQGTLADLASVIPDRDACVLRELTKIHEEIVRGTLRELAAKEIEARGEATLVIAGAGEPDDAEAPLDLDAYIDARLAAGQSPRTIAEALAALTGEPRRSVYQRVLARTAK